MKSIFGWSLPPGVSKLPGDEPDPSEIRLSHRCSCGAFLPMKADRTLPYEDVTECDGRVTTHEEGYDESLVRILGEEFRDKTYPVYFAPCGVMHGPETHAPHKIVNWAGTVSFTACRKCGKVNEVRD